MIKRSSRCQIGLPCVLALQALLPGASAQDANPHEIGVVYYAEGSGFKALEKETAPASGRSNFSAKVKGSHAIVRLATGSPQRFRVCSVDPDRYRLYTLRSTKNSRDVTLTKINIWIGGAKSVLSQSEIPITIQAADSGCFTITPKEPLTDGEYAISPTGEEYAFTFGVGAVKQAK
jgi:hypothetical protein